MIEAKQYGVCDLKYAIELKELGVKQEGLWSWFYNSYMKKHYVQHEAFDDEDSKVCRAITVSELADVLPKFRIKKIDNGYFIKSYPFDDVFDKSLANAMAKMLIYLIKKGTIKL